MCRNHSVSDTSHQATTSEIKRNPSTSSDRSVTYTTVEGSETGGERTIPYRIEHHVM